MSVPQFKLKDVPAEANILTSAWYMNKKYSGFHIEGLNARGCEKVDGFHYGSANIAYPVTKHMRIKIVLVLVIMAPWKTKIIDVKL